MIVIIMGSFGYHQFFKYTF